MKTIRAKVLDTDYDESRRLIKWLIKNLEDGSEFTLAWLDEDLAAQFGINKQLEPKHIKMFCQMMTGKDFNLEMHSRLKKHDADFFKDEKKVEEADEVMKQYPFMQVMDQISEEKNGS